MALLGSNLPKFTAVKPVNVVHLQKIILQLNNIRLFTAVNQ